MTQPDSRDTRKGGAQEIDQPNGGILDPLPTDDNETQQTAGNVPATSAPSDPPADPHAYTRGIAHRLQSAGLWKGQAEFTRDDLMKSSKGKFPDDKERQRWVYGELERIYLKPAEGTAVQSETATGSEGAQGLTTEIPLQSGNSTVDSGQIQGLATIPDDWPELPANASLGAELGWVQANRLRIVEERLGAATLVRLDRSLSPAPSWAALGWLETSIRSYAKFVDVAAKVSGTSDDESVVMKRERRSVDEVKALLREMEEASGACPHCGRSG